MSESRIVVETRPQGATWEMAAKEDRTVVLPEAVEAATLAFSEVLIIPDPLNPEVTLIVDGIQAAINAFIAVQFGIER